MMAGMVGCEWAVSQTARAAAVIPGVLAMSSKLGAVDEGDHRTPWRNRGGLRIRRLLGGIELVGLAPQGHVGVAERQGELNVGEVSEV
jgi:hypothetical protein